MRRRPSLSRRRGATRAIPALVVVACAVAAAAAYAATRPAARPAGRSVAASPVPTDQRVLPRRRVLPHRDDRRGVARPARPRISDHPEPIATASAARFAFLATGATAFQCRLDGAAWSSCRSPRAYSGLAVGEHVFSVRGVARRAPRRAASQVARPAQAARPAGAAAAAAQPRPSLVAGPAASFVWRLVEPKSFSIQPQLGALQPLLPGAPAQPLPVLVANPNEVTIFVTALSARATSGPPGCDGSSNLELLPAGVSATAPLTVPAGGSVSLPAPGFAAPSIALRDLPTAQDACEGGSFGLDFSGEAHG